MPGAPLGVENFYDPTQKDRRTDHAIIVQHKDNFTRTLRSTTEYTDSLRSIEWRSGLHAWATEAKSSNWGARSDWQTDVYSSFSGALGDRLHWHAGFKAEKHEECAVQLLPEANLFFAVDSTTGLSLWANQQAYYPGFLARYATGPFGLGYENLNHSLYTQIGLAGEKQFDHLFFHASAAFQRQNNQVASFYDGRSVNYINVENHGALSFDAMVDYFFLPKWRLVLKSNVYSDINAEPFVSQRPNFYAKTFLQYHLVAFKGDLNARLRAGAFILGERQAPVPFYADYSLQQTRLDPAVYPYVHAVLYYGDAEIFLSYENYIDADVQYVYGYSMPQLWLRYGFIWHFVD